MVWGWDMERVVREKARRKSGRLLVLKDYRTGDAWSSE